MGGNVAEHDYQEATFDATTALAGILSLLTDGVYAAAAGTFSLIREAATMWVLGRYDEQLLESRWNLGLALETSRNPQFEQAMKSSFDRSDAALAMQNITFLKAMAASQTTQNDLLQGVFKETAADPFMTVAVKGGLAIVSAAALPAVGVNPTQDACGECLHTEVKCMDDANATFGGNFFNDKMLAAITSCQRSYSSCTASCQ